MAAMGPVEAFGRQEDRMFLHLTLLDQSGERGAPRVPRGCRGLREREQHLPSHWALFFFLGLLPVIGFAPISAPGEITWAMPQPQEAAATQPILHFG